MNIAYHTFWEWPLFQSWIHSTLSPISLCCSVRAFILASFCTKSRQMRDWRHFWQISGQTHEGLSNCCNGQPYGLCPYGLCPGGSAETQTFAVTKLNQRRTLFGETLNSGDPTTPVERVFKEELQLVIIHPRRQVLYPHYIGRFQKSRDKLELLIWAVADTINNKFFGIYKKKKVWNEKIPMTSLYSIEGLATTERRELPIALPSATELAFTHSQPSWVLSCNPAPLPVTTPPFSPFSHSTHTHSQATGIKLMSRQLFPILSLCCHKSKTK